MTNGTQTLMILGTNDFDVAGSKSSGSCYKCLYSVVYLTYKPRST